MWIAGLLDQAGKIGIMSQGKKGRGSPRLMTIHLVTAHSYDSTEQVIVIDLLGFTALAALLWSAD